MSKEHGFRVHCIYVVRNGDGNVYYQRRGKDIRLIPGKVAEALDSAAKSAEVEFVEFWCKESGKPPSHD
jgi:hypothetical protein